jgi:hypothetical protein
MKEIHGLFHAINVNQWSSRELLKKICLGKCNGKLVYSVFGIFGFGSVSVSQISVSGLALNTEPKSVFHP